MQEIKKIVIVCGARPNFIKVAPLLRALKKYPEKFSSVLIHTGQHSDENMNKVFFDQLSIPSPDYWLNVNGGSHSKQTGKIMIEFEKVILNIKPDLVLVVGDVNSTMACSITTKKCGFLLAHIEAGLRSRDLSMPEEINRIITDSISDYFFVTEESGVQNLLREGKSKDKIFYVGNIMIDSLKNEEKNILNGAFIKEDIQKLSHKISNYALTTIHRPSNVDTKEKFWKVLDCLIKASKKIEIIWPLHPRTKKQLQKYDIDLPQSIHLLDALPYREVIYLMINSKLVITDSGGIQEETTALTKPCFTMRENTERPITVLEGSNKLVGNNYKKLLKEIDMILYQKENSFKVPFLWDGNSSQRICRKLLEILNKKN